MENYFENYKKINYDDKKIDDDDRKEDDNDRQIDNDDKQIDFNYSLEDILRSSNCYNGWYLVTKYIVENYSHDKIIDLLLNKNKAEKFIIDI